MGTMPGDTSNDKSWAVADLQRERQDMGASDKIEQMELRNCAYAPTANAVERQTQRQLAQQAKATEAAKAEARKEGFLKELERVRREDVPKIDRTMERLQDIVMLAMPGPKGGKAAELAATKIEKAAEAIEKWLGKDARVITNEAGDKIFMNAAETRKLRFDIKNPGRDAPHFHIQERTPGQQRWRDAGDQHRYYFNEGGSGGE